MATVEQIRDAFKATVELAVPSLHPYETVADAVNLPAVIIAPAPEETADFAVAMGRGLDTWQFDVYLLCSYAEAALGQDALDAYISGAGERSIRQAVWNRRSLGRDDVDAHVSGVRGYGGRFDVADIDHVGAVLRLVVHTRGTA